MKKEYKIYGDKRSHEIAQKVLPILVKHAKAGNTIFYLELGRESGYHHRSFNYALGYIGETLEQLRSAWKESIPEINTIVLDKQLGIPGPGMAEFIPEYANLSNAEKKARVEPEQKKVFAFEKWDDVLRELNLD